MSVVFSYRALDKNGQAIKGMVEALDKDSALQKIENLREQGLTDIVIESAKTNELNISTPPSQKIQTKKCPHCAEEILADAEKCKHCGEWLNTKKKLEKEAKENKFANRKKHHVGKTIALIFGFGWVGLIFNAIKVIFIRPKKQQGREKRVVVVRGKNPALAFIFGLFGFGLGQLYNGQLGKFFLLLILEIVLLVTVVGAIVVHWWGIWDAYTTAKKINKGMVRV
jgi:TM2 domain-containing membrane protein YozV